MKTQDKGTVVIPELEEEAVAYGRRLWTPEEDAILRSYHGRISTAAILRYLAKEIPPGRKRSSIDNRLASLGLIKRRG